MSGQTADIFPDILLVRRLQREAAGLTAGRAATALHDLEVDRVPLQRSLDDAVTGYRRNLSEGPFNPAITDGWRMLIGEQAAILEDHDGQLDLARKDASEAKQEWHKSQGREELARDLARQVARRRQRRNDERHMADHADLLAQRRRVL